MSKVWVVRYSTGDYYESELTVHAIFATQEAAEAEALRALVEPLVALSQTTMGATQVRTH